MAANEDSRQSFLGPEIERVCRVVHIAVIGLGGSGSHIAQQLAHVGFQKFLLVDPDTIESSNLNRLVNGTAADLAHRLKKTEIACRTILSVRPAAQVTCLEQKWQAIASELHAQDLIIGCLDSLSARSQLEAVTRRYLIPYIDVGMDVRTIYPEPPRMYGQVAISLPEGPCLRCLGVVTDSALEEESRRYGDAGARPQVVWANGVLASTAVGCAVDLLTGWTRRAFASPLLSYDGNLASIGEDVRVRYLSGGSCPHYPLDQTGPPVFRRVG